MLKPKLFVHLLNKKINSFHFFGIIGFLASAILGAYLCYALNLSWLVLISLVFTGAITFFALVFIVKILTGEENIVYYHHEIGILLMDTLVLKLLGAPVLVYLDICLLGVAAFLAFGRIGCFSVGCCHGIPSENGIKYGLEHVHAGFTAHYKDVILLPVQLIESVFVFFITILGTVLVLQEALPGTVLILYTIVYGAFRFILEFFRGDPERPYWKGFSEAQWTTLGLFLLSVVLSFLGYLPYYNWHIWIVVGLILLMLGVTIYRLQQTVPTYKIKNPHHITEMANGLQLLKNEKKTPSTFEERTVIPSVYTSLGLRISSGKIAAKNASITHYTLSAIEKDRKLKLTLNLPTVHVISKVIQILHHPGEKIEIKTGKSNIYHLVFHKMTT